MNFRYGEPKTVTYRIIYDEATQEHVVWTDETSPLAAYETYKEAEAAVQDLKSDE